MTRITIISMRNWGGAGNAAAAYLLKSFLEVQEFNLCSLIFADDHVAEFFNCGSRIREITAARFGSRNLALEYSAVLNALDARLSDGKSTHISELAAAVLIGNPDVLITTKGVIARLLVSMRDLGYLKSSVRILNYVTNHGHFALNVHESPGIDLHITRLPRATDFMTRRADYAPTFQVSYITGLDDNEVPSWALNAQYVNVVISVNRGTPYFRDVLKNLAFNRIAKRLHIHLLAVDVDDNDAFDEIFDMRSFGILRVVPKLTAVKYSYELSKFMSNPTVFVGKASPNALAEAIRLCLPAIVFPSGLPMEDWVGPWVEDIGFGLVGYTPEETATQIINFADNGALRRKLAIAAKGAQSSELQSLKDGEKQWKTILGKNR